MRYQRVSSGFPIIANHGTIENAIAHRREMEDVANSIFDQKIGLYVNDIIDQKLEEKSEEVYQQAFGNAYKAFMNNLAFDVQSCVNVSMQDGKTIFEDSKTQKVIADNIMREIQKQMRGKFGNIEIK